ncbi:FAD-dependent oxidoreductase [Altericista sp. CCNU0014]|uniref:FAD-dependent oxidoreductase n=1 Tax=Altericista sp. CCNU0014 TaxID=3082949 RepID=UPI00384C801B
MLIDLQHLPPEATLQSDICIIGGGIAGLVLADALRGSGLRVDLLEAGGLSLESRSQALYAADIIGRPYSGTTDGRFRVFGGSSTRWGGQILPLADRDFTQRSHVPESGWPISPVDLEPYYARVESLLGINHLPYTDRLLSQLPVPRPDGIETGLQMRFSKWAPFSQRNLAKTLGQRIKTDPHSKIYYHANATHIQLHDRGQKVEFIATKTYDGRVFRFYSKHFVICAGTVETSRLLLMSNDIHANGIGNHHDLVGRYFHDHLSLPAARIVPESRQVFLKRFAPWFLGQTRHTLKLESTADFQAESGSLNSMGHFVFDAPDDTAFAWLKQILQRSQDRTESQPSVPELGLLSKEFLDLLYLAWQVRVKKRRWSPSRADLMLYIDCEQQPNPLSRISLSRERDALGLPKAAVDWRWGEAERHAMQSYRHLFDRQWHRWNMGKLQWQCNFERSSNWQTLARDIYHPMGGARMSADPSRGVVSPNLQLHGIANLHIASCAVFPTGGSSNPTMTMMAMTLKLADRLKSFEQL